MAIFTLRERMIFLADVAGNLLNDKGQREFFADFYWRINIGQFLTHEIIDCIEKNLATLIQKDKYRE